MLLTLQPILFPGKIKSNQINPGMFTKLILRPNSLPLPIPIPIPFTFLSPPFLFRKPSTVHLLSTAASAAAAVTSIAAVGLPYGPSLGKGRKPYGDSDRNVELADESLDEDSFTRVFDISALRVPSDSCFVLENRLRGHLLNWPRIGNIARVPGDEIDDDLKRFFNSQIPGDSDDESDSLAALNRRIYGKAEGDGETLSSVLYRDELARTFNSRGYAKFRNLAKLSRPKRRKKKEGEKREKKGGGKDECYLVEVIEDQSVEEREDLSGLLGDEYKGGKWRGSTRLLLLDERHAHKSIDELPEAIKVALKEDGSQSITSTCELVRCKLTLFYSYWQMNEILEALLPEGMIIPSAFETVGHIVHLNLRDDHLPYKKLIAKVILDKNKPKIQTVVNKIDVIQNDYRTMQLEVLGGNHSLVTTVVENGLQFQLDLATVYWNSRLATERQRLLNCFTHDDVVCDVFAGVGPIAISAAKKVKHVYANDLNPNSVSYLKQNCVLNKVTRKIEVFNMDGRRFINAIFTSKTVRPITQVVMNLPNDAAEFLDAFRGVFRDIPREDDCTLPKIHVYGFSKAQDPEFDFQQRIRIALVEVAVEVEVRKVRLVAPAKWMMCASFILPRRVAFARTL